MKVLDLFSGLGGWTEAFVDRGHEVTRVDHEKKFSSIPHTIVTDVRMWEPEQSYDVVLASPPCEAFSVARISRNWIGSKTEPLVPRTKKAVEGMKLVLRTLQLLDEISPTYWWMENPSGAMKRLEMLEGITSTTITHCKYGKHYQKRTDLWGEWPDTWRPIPSCTGHPRHGTVKMPNGMEFVLDADGKPCHELSRRGMKTGVQGLKDSATRALIPYPLSLSVCLALEEALER